MMCFHINFETIDSVLFCGLLKSRLSLGSSVARANEAKLSMIKLTQTNYTAVKGDYLIVIAPTIAIVTAATLTVS